MGGMVLMMVGDWKEREGILVSGALKMTDLRNIPIIKGNVLTGPKFIKYKADVMQQLASYR
jgi:hypothetical protein